MDHRARGNPGAGGPAGTGSGAAVGTVPADPRRSLPTLYQHHREEALRAARGSGGERAAVLRALAAPERQLLALETSGRGLLTEVFGDLAAAPAVAVLVGGVGTEVATFDAGTRRLRTFLDGLHRHLPARRVVLVCHSYGSPVCAAALADARARGVRDVVDLASPGVGQGRLPAGVRRWTATGSADPVRWVPHVRIGGLGLGRDPATTPGARRLPVPANCDHDDYLAPGSPTLTAVADLVRP
ncbi:hypothetical protein GTQ99_22470 [Kineococcus sp. T13]|nr:hypothetical protein [Kineococcus vitellinus]